MNKFGRIALKTILWIVLSIIMLVVLIFVLIQVPAVQNVVRKKAVNFLEKKIGTPVEIDRLSLDLPKQIVLEGVYFEDQKGDTLLAGDTLKVDISMLKLLKNQVEVNLVDLRGITANVQRTTPDSAFNFDYIINAFITQQKDPTPPPVDSTAAMKFSISKINLDRIRVNYQDAVTASDVGFYVGHFDTEIEKFDLDSMRF
ncbi:MAG TPA: AsmA family protein, partial [Sphingobacteriaceae bacterium]